MNLFRRVFICLAIMGPPYTYASATANSAGSVDITKAFSNLHRVVFEGREKVTNHVVILSSIKKVNGQWRTEDNQVLSGELFKQTFEFKPQDIDQILQELRLFVAQQEWQQSFHCSGLECGGSHGWANEIFENRLLYGKDAQQYYWVWRPLKVDTLSPWYSLYLVERGNRRIYLQWQIATPNANAQQQAENMLSSWEKQGYANLPSDLYLIDATMLKTVQDWIELKSTNEYAVVGHDHSADKFLSAQQSTSLTSAKAVAELLKNRFPEISWRPFGLGSLAPRSSITSDSHVELVPLMSPSQ